MFILNAPVEKSIELENKIYLLQVRCPEITSDVRPGQFLNVRVSESMYPLLRRPFSVCDVDDEHLYLMFNILGEGTKILARKHKDETIDIIGPLGNGFNLEGEFDTAVIVAGGLGAAPFPFFTRMIKDHKKILTFIGGRSHKDIITYGMQNISIATEDGSLGLKGNVIHLLQQNLEQLKSNRIKIFSCGPTGMLRALKDFTIKNNFDCEVSTECAMACGFGICQGCPIESTEHPDKYHLVCKDGPVFNVKDVLL
ncbi:MAG: dihydroorotate dehydrogenase electron transfer subunit [Ignavibacteriales bacterium]|nr:MAG: dihydroorotate dehydrogenase electron transfer subunit [Ignavibacteriales bacterium]